MDGVGDESDGPGAYAGELDEDNALETAAAAALAEDGHDLFGGAVDAFDEGEVFDEVFDLGEDLAADEEAAEDAEDVHKENGKPHRKCGRCKRAHRAEKGRLGRAEDVPDDPVRRG